MALDLVVLAVLVAAALGGAVSGALRQVVQLAAVAIGWLAARQFAPSVAEGFGRTVPGFVARPAASVLLFLGGAALVGFAGRAILNARGLAHAVRGPSDRGVGALLGGAKGALVVWVFLSAATLAGAFRLGPVHVDPDESDFAGFARDHNLLARVDPEKARTLERLLKLARDPVEAARLERDPDARRLLEDPRVRALAGAGRHDAPEPSAVETERLLADPEVA
ncbi:MAG TPA: CvpA family protein, partial [Anaeromyxobacteraceae bacterium]|nr:CvpA family protein [Anaeromyxobacteraceae bacterium]